MRKVMTFTAATLLSLNAYANSCSTVRFADVGWTDITATTAVTTELLHGLGYQTKTDLLSVRSPTHRWRTATLMSFSVTGCRLWKATLPSTVTLAQ